MAVPNVDPWVVQPRERTWYEEQFKSLRPNNGIITGEQAKGFLLQSQLPPAMLGQIWALSDTDSDGKMDINEFSIACKLIHLKLRGTEIPKTLPPSLISSLKNYSSNSSTPTNTQNLIGGPPARPQLPKIDNSNVGLLSQVAPQNIGQNSLVQTAIVPPLQSNIPPAIPPLPKTNIVPPLQQSFANPVPPMRPQNAPLIPGLVNQPLVNQQQPITGLGNQQQPLTGLVNQQQPVTGLVNQQQPITGLVNQQQPITGLVNQQQPITGLVNQQQPITGLVNQQQPITGLINQSQPLISGFSQPAKPPQPAGYSPQQPTGFSQHSPAFSSPQQPTQAAPIGGIPIHPSGIVPAQPNILGSFPQPSQIPVSSGIVTQQPGFGTPLIASVGPTTAPIVQPVSGVSRPSPPSVPGSITSNTPRASIDKGLPTEPAQVEWSVPHQTKLKYTQLFNTTDRARSGYLSGAQARNVMVQSKLPQNILAQIWALSDMDADGQLGCEEFVLAMHLCEQATSGIMPPTVLPPDLIPPTFRRPPRTNSISSQGSTHPETTDHALLSHQTSFEDKRKENFEKGQAELERRRKALLDIQRKEAEERERKEREENERKEKARQEAERKRLVELEAQMREQQEQERLKEEERKRQQEQREAARKEMERQRQLEWEKQRSQELQQQRQREQEKVLKLKAKNQSLTIELTSLNDQVKELSQKICDTRVGVSNIKTTIDGMRSTRDTQMQEMSQLKNKLKEQNARLLALSHEKAKMDAKNKINSHMTDAQNEQNKAAFENKEITIKQLKDKLEDMQKQIQGKMSDIENNNSQLSDLKTQLTSLVSECESLYAVYEEKRNQVLEMKGQNKNTSDYNSGWKNTDQYWESNQSNQDEWPVDNWATNAETTVDETSTTPSGVAKYRALYEFVARNSDEISFQPGDIILVPLEQKGEPGWLAGKIRNHTGWFPESYVEPLDTSALYTHTTTDDTETKRLEGIAEVPETLSDTSSVEPTLNPQPTESVIEKTEIQPIEELSEPSSGELEYYIASYPYQSVEQGDLSFNAGEMIIVLKKEGDWWTGKIGENVGIFPSNYVQKMDMNAAVSTNNNTEQLQAVASALQENIPSGTDNEVSEINEKKLPELDKSPDFAAMSANTQTLRSGKKPEIASVIAPYQATSPEQLSLQRGQLIMVRKKTDSGWWEGELQAKGKRRQVGWFPASYVKVLNSSGRASGRTTPVSTTRMQQELVIDKVVALFPYTANNPDELSFLKDDIISVTARDEPSWWRGELNGVSGLFPSNYVGPLQSYDPLEKMRQECINELILTEKAYLEDMTIVHNIFETPLRKSGVISEEEVHGIFVNWVEIIETNRKFLEDLYNRRESGSLIFGDIICSHLPRMTGYITFCSNQLDSAALLQRLTENSSSFRDVVRKCQSHPATKGMPLSSFLIKPMQRITKYPLLIQKILENTAPHHQDHHYLSEALKKADRFCKQLNENVRVKENSERLEWLQTHVNCEELKIKFNSSTNCLGPRKLLHHGMLQKLKSGKELICFLLSDFILLVVPNKPMGSRQFNFQQNNNWGFKMYKQPIFVNELQVSKGNAENIENGTDMNRLLKIQDKSLQLSLLSPTANDCNLWLKRITDAKNAFEKVQTISHTSKTIFSLHRRSMVVLKIESVEAFEIKRPKNLTYKKGKMYSDNIFCKISMGDQEQVTDVAKNNSQNGNLPHNGALQIPYLIWNASMQFHVKNINEDNLIIVVYEKCLFTPDEFLGRAEVKVKDIIHQTRNTNGPILKRLILHQVESGEVELKLDMQLFEN